MPKKRWEIKNKSKTADILEILLENRGIKTKKEKEWFLNPTHPGGLSLPSVGLSRKAMQMAVDRIAEAIKRNEKIVVYGDYDADGVCATAILWEILDSLGADVLPYIPDRFNDGYGLSGKSVEKLKAEVEDLKLIITVDNGIVAYNGVDAAKKLGVDVIISDHHQASGKLPSAYSIIHTTQTSGAGVAWFFAKEISRKLKNDAQIGKLELVAIGVIADQLPLVGVNRSLVKYGLEELNTITRLGLRKLLMVSGLLEKKIGTYEVGFMIAPRINAPGRMASGMDALRLLCTRNPKRAEDLALTLNKLNKERQDTVEAAVSFMEGNLPTGLESVIVMADANYHEGVIGLIAGRVVEKLNRPAIVLSMRAEIAKGSARSVPGFNIIEAIRAQSELIIEGGGHEMAAGFSIEIKNIAEFSQKINEYATPLLGSEVLERKLMIDCELGFSQVNQKVYNTLAQLEPYGVGNPAPVFATRNVKIVSQRLVGKLNNHLKMVLEHDSTKVEAMMFNCPDKSDAKAASVAYRMSENTWNGNTNIELILKDIKYE